MPPKKIRELQAMHAQQVKFVAEQDGPAERELKSQLAPLFRKSPIRRAFLARVDFGGSGGPEVALCLAGPDELAKELLDQIAGAYSNTAVVGEHIDVLLLSEAQVKDISSVCAPFYTGKGK